MSLPQVAFGSLNPGFVSCGSWRTAAVLVEIIERVEACLLLLVCLERVAGLEIGVLHGRDPAGPGESNERKQKKTERNRNKITGQYNRQTKGWVAYVMLCMTFELKTVQKL